MKRTVVAAGMAASFLALAGPAHAVRDFSRTALNIIPSGQYGSVPIPPKADDQARMYDALTPLFDDVTPRDLTRYFKSEKLGTKGQGRMRRERVPRAGVRILRDKHNVPHIRGRTNDDVTWGAGWALAHDRELLLEQARFNARVAVLDVPNISAIGLIVGLKTFRPSAQGERELRKEIGKLRRYGKPGRRVLHDMRVYVKGVNAYYRANNRPHRPWTIRDVIALNAIKSELFGEGGGDEVDAAEMLDGLQDQLGADRGYSVWNDLRQRQDPETPVSIKGNFPYAPLPARRTGNVVIDNGSYEPVPTPGAAASAAVDGEFRRQSSNVLMVAGKRSRSGNPLFVGGPQIGYFYPGLTLEMDLQGPGWRARGATSAPFPGYILIGRREDFVWSLTSAGADIVDIFVETLCGGSDTKYLFRGQCRDMRPFHAGTLDGQRGHVQPDGARAGGRLREGRRTPRGDLAQAVELPARRRGPADLPAPHARARAERARVHQGRGDLAADVQHVLRRREPGGEHHHRAAAAAGPGSRSGAPDRRSRELRVARLPRREDEPEGRSEQRRDEQLEQQAGARVPRGRRPVELRVDRPRGPAERQHGQAPQAHARDADRRDERRGDAGRARR